MDNMDNMDNVTKAIDPIDKISPYAIGNAIGSVPSSIASLRQPTGRYSVDIEPLEPIQLSPGFNDGAPMLYAPKEQSNFIGYYPIVYWGIAIFFIMIIAIVYLVIQCNENSQVQADPEHVAAILATHLGEK